MLSLLVDTHILIWWRSEPARLSRAQAQVLADAEHEGDPLAISAISLRELAAAGQRGRLQISVPWEEWLDEIDANPRLTVLPITARIAAESVRLGPDFPKDPADQLIVATALCHGLQLVTADKLIRRWGKVRLV